MDARPLHASRLFQWRRQLGSWLFLPLVLAAVLSGRYWAEGSAMDELLDACSIALLAAGIALRTWATLYIGGRKSRELVVHGPYGLCRNPLYLGSLLIGFAVALFLQSLTLALAIAVLGPLLYLPVVREEERVMLAEHGEEYRAYRARVPRLLPSGGGGPASGEELKISLVAIRRHALRSLALMLLIPAGELIALLQSNGSLPRLLALP